MRLLSAAERLAEERGPKILVTGIPGIGKTSLLATASPVTLSQSLFVNSEAGDLSVAGLSIASYRPRLAGDSRHRRGGQAANPARPPNAAYSQAHYDAVVANPDLAELTRFSTVSSTR